MCVCVHFAGYPVGGNSQKIHKHLPSLPNEIFLVSADVAKIAEGVWRFSRLFLFRDENSGWEEQESKDRQTDADDREKAGKKNNNGPSIGVVCVCVCVCVCGCR